MLKHSATEMSKVENWLTSQISSYLVFWKILTVKMIATLLFLILSCTPQPFEEELDDDLSGAILEPKITKLILVNAETNQDIGVLNNNSSFAQSNISIRAEGNAKSVTFVLSGAESYKRTDSYNIFSIKGEDSGIYRKWIPKLGEYTLKVTPCGKKDGKGVKGETVTYKFTVTNGGIASNMPNTPIDQISSDELWVNGDFSETSIGLVSSRPSFVEWEPSLEKASWYNFQGIAFGTEAENMYTISENQLISRIVKRGSSSGRNQWQINSDQTSEIIHHNYDMWLHPDISYLINTSSNNIDWYSIWEIWNKTTPDGKENRWSIYIKKNPADGYKTLVLGLRSSYQQNGKWYNEYPWVYTSEALKFGEWFNFDVYWNKSTNQWKISINGNAVADFVGMNNNPAYPQYGIDWINPLKHYVGASIFDFMQRNGKSMEIRYRNFKWYKK